MGIDRLIRRINRCKFKGYLYNQLPKSNQKRGKYYRRFKRLCRYLNEDKEYGLTFYLYLNMGYLQVDIYSPDCYEGSVRGLNFFQLFESISKVYLQVRDSNSL